MLEWIHPPPRGFGIHGNDSHRWFPDGTLNVCYNALDRHVDTGAGERVALIYDSRSPDDAISTPTEPCAIRWPDSRGPCAAVGFGPATPW
jgi:Acetyl-coenzyme A synthetase N-terminus